MAEQGEIAISVVICTYDRHAMVPQTIETVLGQELDAGAFDLIVVDNSPDQAAAARCADRYRGRRALRYVLEPRPGLSHARNVGLGLARGRHVAFIDDDGVARPGWLQALVEAFAAFPAAGAVGGRVVPRWSSPRPAWLHDRLFSYLSLIDWGEETRVLERREYVAGANMAVVRDEGLACGGFSPALGRVGSGASLMSNEDVELVARLAARGRPAVYAPAAIVEHIIDAARLTQSWFRRRAAWQAVSDFIAAGAAAPRHAADAAARMRLAARLRRTPRPGCFADTADPEEFLRQVQAAYHLTFAALGGGVEVDAGWFERLAAGEAAGPRHGD